MKIVATIPLDWLDWFEPILPKAKYHQWRDRNTERIVLRSLVPQPWGETFSVHLTADFGETRGGRRYEQRGAILLFPLDGVGKKVELEREFRVGKVFYCDRAKIPALLWSDGQSQVIYWVG